MNDWVTWRVVLTVRTTEPHFAEDKDDWEAWVRKAREHLRKQIGSIPHSQYVPADAEIDRISPALGND